MASPESSGDGGGASAGDDCAGAVEAYVMASVSTARAIRIVYMAAM